MSDRVHPRDSPRPEAGPEDNFSESSETTLKSVSPDSDKPLPQPGTYVIHIPKDQVYRVPPPENASRYQHLARRSNRRRPCCLCLCWSFALLAIFLVLSAVAAGIFYLVVKPESPNYSVKAIIIRGLNLTTTTTSSSSVQMVSPEFDITVRSDNPNDKIGIYYQKDSSVEIFYSDVRLCNGVLPVFYQPSNNVTAFHTTLKGSGIELSGTVKNSLVEAQKRGEVPLDLKIRAPVKIKVGSVKTWKITVKVDCDITVDKLTADAKIVSNDCDYGVDLW
ncbi:NDR1/HIN1-like protein 13 [Juglans microcarpa x Juglans regia]|uniref:NDR1/HIN1-like protein 13 n=1 Tax=Juglans microcarpa x Juglans regia TaxID=2249226 RepID=UPI001B7EA615|nr:NDR1/HIN1-like protein 13 [Juglans microcarpa x Juglans regia]